MCCECTLTESLSKLVRVFPYCSAGLGRKLPSLTSIEAFRWCSWIKDREDIFPFLRTNTKLGQHIHPLSTYFAKLNQIYIIEKPCTSYHIGRIAHTIINQPLKIFIKIVFFFTTSNNKDLLIFSVLLCSLYCKRQMSPLAIFPRRTWPTLL